MYETAPSKLPLAGMSKVSAFSPGSNRKKRPHSATCKSSELSGLHKREFLAYLSVCFTSKHLKDFDKIAYD
jgi:hypothetical protein